MSTIDYVEQWVCLVREGRFGSNAFIVTRETIESMARSFAIRHGPIPVGVSAEILAAPTNHLPSFSGAEIVKVEVREDERGCYLAGLFRTPDVCIAFLENALDRSSGMRTGPTLTAAYFSHKKLQPST